jgi:hypothetical protein
MLFKVCGIFIVHVHGSLLVMQRTSKIRLVQLDIIFSSVSEIEAYG